MNEPTRGFSDQEFETRTRAAQDAMRLQGLDAILVMTEPEVRYFSGFLTPFWQSPTRPWFLVVPASGKPIAVIPNIGAAVMGRTWLDDVRTWSSPNPEDEGISILLDVLRDVASNQKTIGVPMGPETQIRMPLLDFEFLRTELSEHRFQDATSIIQHLRMTKSEAEIDKIRHVCSMISSVFEDLPNFVHVGMTEIEIFREFKKAALDQGVDDVAYLVGGVGFGGLEDIISPPSSQKSQIGDVLMLDTGATFDGYFCDFDRNVAFGSADDAVKRAYETVHHATEAGLAAARPGATCEDIYHAMQSVMDADGALGNDVGRIGHGLGMQLTEWPSHRPGDTTVLREGMVITLEPGMEFAPSKVMVHEENIVIRDGAPEILSRRAPSELPIIG
jgi:Xaa-Pro dipeptidase